MLKLVPPPRGEGQDPPRRRKGIRSPALLLTREERSHLRAALQNLRRSFGTWRCLADAMGVREGTLTHAGGASSKAGPALALRAAKVAGASVESILTGSITLAGACPTCGARPATGRFAANGGAS
jgi:hypothetical protein